MENRYDTSVAYFSMEIGVDEALKTYSGGLGYLAGSHMRSAYELNQNLVGVSILWKYGYYEQVRSENFHMEVKYIQKYYSFLEDTGVIVDVKINGHNIRVKAYKLPEGVLGTVPIYFLTTDIDENDYLSRTITHHLYDPTQSTRIAQEIVLGAGGAKVLDKIGVPEIYHMNEAHPLPLVFQLYQKHKKIEEVKKRVVFTTHTPEKAGNSSYDYDLLKKMNYFSGLSVTKVKKLLCDYSGHMECTAAALKFSKIANGVSQMHADVAKDMWKDVVTPDHIIGITNAQNIKFWQDKTLSKAFEENDDALLLKRKKELKKKLFKVVAKQEGDLFKEDVLTIVWARRFAAYKRPELIIRSLNLFFDVLEDQQYPLQIIWAGKPHPKDQDGINLFNSLVDITYTRSNCAVLVGYELELSSKLKKGADLWLNTPKITREASGTSGMTAAMNGAINFTIPDGWIPEFEKDKENCFLIPSSTDLINDPEQDEKDYQSLAKVLRKTILPMYYNKPEEWVKIMKNSIDSIFPYFESGRMADEYYKKMYDFNK